MIKALVQRDIDILLSHPQFAIVPAIALGFCLLILSYVLPSDFQNHTVEITLVMISFVVLMKPSTLQHDRTLGIYDVLPKQGQARFLYWMVKLGVVSVFWSIVTLVILGFQGSEFTMVTVIHGMSFVVSLICIYFMLNRLIGRGLVYGALVFTMGLPLIIPSLLLSISGLKAFNSTLMIGHMAYSCLCLFSYILFLMLKK